MELPERPFFCYKPADRNAFLRESYLGEQSSTSTMASERRLSPLLPTHTHKMREFKTTQFIVCAANLDKLIQKESTGFHVRYNLAQRNSASLPFCKESNPHDVAWMPT